MDIIGRGKKMLIRSRSDKYVWSDTYMYIHTPLGCEVCNCIPYNYYEAEEMTAFRRSVSSVPQRISHYHHYCQIICCFSSKGK